MSKHSASACGFILVALTLALGACGKKPTPRTSVTPPPTSETRAAPPPASDPLPASHRTLGGVELAPMVDPGAEGEAVIAHAMDLVADKARGIEGLVRSGLAARRVVLALLASKSLDELTGALEVLAADGDPTGARPEAVDAVIGLLSHEVATVRDRAWALAPLLVEGDALIALVRRVAPDEKATVVRLLELWDSPQVRAALIELARDTDPGLAREAAFTLTTPTRPVAPETLALVKDLLITPATHELGLTVARRLPAEAFDRQLRLVASKTIDDALVGSDPALVLAAIRATVVLPLAERLPLLEQLARDGREDVRRVAAETLGAPIANDKGAEAERVAEILDAMFTDGEGAVRIAAIRSRAAIAAAHASAQQAAQAAESLGAKLRDGHRGVRLAAAVVLCHDVFGEAGAKLVETQLSREDLPGQTILLEALAHSKSRPHVAVAMARLDEPMLAPAAHQALSSASGKDFPAKSADWRPWFDETFPAPAGPAAPAPPSE